MITRTNPNCQTESIIAMENSDWRKILSASTLSLKDLLGKLEIPIELANAYNPDSFGLEQSSFPIRVPEPFITRMRKGDINDPLLLQVLPLAKELEYTPGYTKDPLQEAQFNSAPGLIHKYHGRALLIITKACAIHCRYCFRRHFPYQDNQPNREEWNQALSYLRQNPLINEVIYSGGDPLAANDKHLSWLTDQIAEIPHIHRLRIHTRLPVVLPQRVDENLLRWLANWQGQKVMVIHCNHPNELDERVKKAINELKNIGVTLLNQTVLLKGINDDASILVDLSEKLFNFGVLPYYLHVMDTVESAAHFSIPDSKAQRLIGKVSAHLPGYLVPKLVREKANEKSKTLLSPIL